MPSALKVNIFMQQKYMHIHSEINKDYKGLQINKVTFRSQVSYIKAFRFLSFLDFKSMEREPWPVPVAEN